MNATGSGARTATSALRARGSDGLLVRDGADLDGAHGVEVRVLTVRDLRAVDVDADRVRVRAVASRRDVGRARRRVRAHAAVRKPEPDARDDEQRRERL